MSKYLTSGSNYTRDVEPPSEPACFELEDWLNDERGIYEPPTGPTPEIKEVGFHEEIDMGEDVGSDNEVEVIDKALVLTRGATSANIQNRMIGIRFKPLATEGEENSYIEKSKNHDSDDEVDDSGAEDEDDVTHGSVASVHGNRYTIDSKLSDRSKAMVKSTSRSLVKGGKRASALTKKEAKAAYGLAKKHGTAFAKKSAHLAKVEGKKLASGSAKAAKSTFNKSKRASIALARGAKKRTAQALHSLRQKASRLQRHLAKRRQANRENREIGKHSDKLKKRLSRMEKTKDARDKLAEARNRAKRESRKRAMEREKKAKDKAQRKEWKQMKKEREDDSDEEDPAISAGYLGGSSSLSDHVKSYLLNTSVDHLHHSLASNPHYHNYFYNNNNRQFPSAPQQVPVPYPVPYPVQVPAAAGAGAGATAGAVTGATTTPSQPPPRPGQPLQQQQQPGTVPSQQQTTTDSDAQGEVPEDDVAASSYSDGDDGTADLNGQTVAFRIGSSIMYHIGEKESEILETLPPKEDLGLDHDDDDDDDVDGGHQQSDGETQGDAKRRGHEEEKQATTAPHEGGGESDVDYIDEIAAHGDDDEEDDKAHEQGGGAKAPAAVEKHEAPTEADDAAKADDDASKAAARLSEIDTALGYVYVSYYEPQCVAMISQKYGYSSMPEFIRRIGCRIRKWLNTHIPVKYQIMANHYLRHKKEHDDDTFRKMTRWVQRTIKDSVKNVKDELHAFFYIQSSIHSQSFGEGQLEEEGGTHDEEEEEEEEEDHGSPYVIGRRRGRHHSNKKKHNKPHPHHHHHAKSKKKHHKHKAISEIKANPHLHWFPAHPEYHERVNEVATRLAQGDWWPTSPSEVDLTKYSDNALMAPRLDKDINKLIVSVHGGGEILGHHHHEKEATSSSSSSESDSESDEDRGKAGGAHENSGDVFDRIYDVDEFDEFIKAMEMDHDDLEEYMSEAIDFFRKKFGVDFTSKDAMRSDANALTIVLPNGIVFEPFAVNRNIKLTASAHGVAASGDGSASSSSSKDREPHVMMGGFKMCVTRDTSAGSDPQSSRLGLKEGDMAMFGDYVVIPVPDSDEKTKQVLKDIFHDRKEEGGEDVASKSETQHHDGESDGEGAGEEDSNNHIKIHFESTSLVKLPTYDQIVARKAARGALKPSGSWLGEGESGKKLLVEGGVISHTLKIDSHHLPDTTAREGMAQHTIKWKLVFEASFGPHNRTHHQHHKKIFCYINDTLSFDPIAQSGGGGGGDESDD